MSYFAEGHGIGGGKDVIIGNYLIDFGYDKIYPTEEKPLLITFELKNSTTKSTAEFTLVEITILDEHGNILLSKSIYHDSSGKASLIHDFPRQGSYKIVSRFKFESKTIVEADFPIEVAEKSNLIAENKVFIAITDQGFEPDFIRIAKGATAIFKNKGDKLHWPASDFHPTHTLYPGSGIKKCGTSEEEKIFDACRSLKKNEQFSFTFNEAGTWSVHDHLHPGLTMVIGIGEKDNIKYQYEIIAFISDIFNRLKKLFGIIDEDNDSDAKKSDAYALENISISELAKKIKGACETEKIPEGYDPIICYANEFESVALKFGPEFSFKVLDSLKEIDRTATNCHFIVHGIGWGTYKRSPDDIRNLTASMGAACAYGAVHGLLEQYIAALPDEKLTKGAIKDICGDGPPLACVHGIGHIILVEVKDNLDEAVELCSAFQHPEHYQMCLNGAYMEHMIAGGLASEGLVPYSRRYYWYKHIDEFEELCRSLEGRRATACWTEITHATSIKFKNDPKKMFDFCNTAQSIEATKRCRLHSLNDLVITRRYNLSLIKHACTIKQQDDPTFEEECYRYLVAIKLSYYPTKESADIIDYCLSLDKKFHNSCLSKISELLGEIKAKKEVLFDLCQNAPTGYRKICMGNNAETNVN